MCRNKDARTTDAGKLKRRQNAELKQKDAIPRTLVYEAEVFGYFVRLYYLDPDDSYYLTWRLPGEDNTVVGDKYFINPDDVRFSFRHCVGLLRKSYPDVEAKLSEQFQLCAAA